MVDQDSLATAEKTRTGFSISKSARWLVPVIYITCGFAFILDLYRDSMLAYGIIYAPLVATSVLHKGRSGLGFMTALAFVMVMAGAFFPFIARDLPDLIGNRILSIAAILATAVFVQQARNIRDRLAVETQRAEAAERIKTQVLTDLSQEIRTPLHTLLGVLTLTMADSKPSQREALGRVRSDGKELLATIDNLIDLTQIDVHQLRRQTIDIATIARDAAESAGPAARDRQITIAIAGQDRTASTEALGDSWAMRRILDNLLANAVRITPPGGIVSVSVNHDAGSVITSVSDTGLDLPDGDVRNIDAVTTTGGTGLALSNRLALAMNGKLTATHQPGSGATVSLWLPAI